MAEVRIVRLHPDAVVPRRARGGDAGVDLCSVEEVVLAAAGGRALVPTGLAVELPSTMVAYVMPRSGLALRHGVTCLNAPGVIDSGYRGEVGVVLLNTDPTEDFVVRPGDRIAQLVVAHLASYSFAEVDELGDSERGAGGFGHTGVASS